MAQMTERKRQQRIQTPPEDYVAWVKRLLKVALDGGPHVVSARFMADRYRGIGDPDLQVETAIRDAKRAMRARAELKRVVALLVQEGILAERDANGIAYARWLIHARLATVIALAYGHDPEKDWVKAAILESTVRTTGGEESGHEAEQEVVAIWKRLLELGGPELEKRIAGHAGVLLARLGFKSGGGLLASVALASLAVALSRWSAWGHARRCQQTGDRAQRGFRYLRLASTTERALAH